MKKSMVLLPLVIVVMISSTPVVFASNDDPYDSGHDHGCDDATKDSSDRYINQDGKGPSQHTSTFMNGYNAGFSECSGSNNQPSQQQQPSTGNSACPGIAGALGGLLGGAIAGPGGATFGSQVGPGVCK